MPVAIWIGLIIVVVAVLIYLSIKPSFDKIVDQAAKKGDITPILDAIARKSDDARPTAFNHAIRRLWDRYERPLAVRLVKELAERHGSSTIAQYWLRQVITVEPRMAKESFSQEFLTAHYQPEVAAKCGNVG
jgi:hypothetical protein